MKNLGKYEILEELGSGSMGTVYRAHDTVIDRDIALKTIRTGIETEPEMRERFYREARSCGRLQHPHIVTIYDLGEEDKTAYIAMELLDGLDFRKLINQQRELPVIKKIEWMAQICDALGHAHRHGVIHRDVKPSNLFLTDTECVKVLDFGIARLTSSRLTVAGKILGTPNYMAPEQILANACDGRADLFSAGVVFFELLVYKHPFRGAMIPQRIVESEPDSLFDHQSNLPPILEKIFARALAKNPDDRYSNAAAFSTDLRAVLDTMRNHAAPSLLLSELPSDRVETSTLAPLPDPSTVEPALAPAGEDSAEWRNSEALMLLPQFEKAAERQDWESAKKFYGNLLRVTLSDGRFAEAIASCRARLEQAVLKGGSETVLLPSDPGRPIFAGAKSANASAAHTQRICIECGAANRSAARFCIGCGANLDDLVPVKVNDEIAAAVVVPAAGLLDTNFDRTEIYKPELPQEPAVKKNDSGRLPSSGVNAFVAAPLEWMRAHLLIVIPACLAVLIAFIVLGAMWVLRSQPVDPAVATANVAAPEMVVHSAPGSGSKHLYALHKGDSVNIVMLPNLKTPEWVKVQSVVNGNGKATGFSRHAELTGMIGRDAKTAMNIVVLVYPDKPGQPPSPARLEALRNLAGQYPGSPEAKAALAEITRLEEKIETSPLPKPEEEIKPALDVATRLQEAVQVFQAGNYNDSEKTVLEILTEQPESAEAKQLLLEIQQSRRVRDLRRAQKAFDEARMDDAANLVFKVLSEDPKNGTAKQLLAKIQRYR